MSNKNLNYFLQTSIISSKCELTTSSRTDLPRVQWGRSSGTRWRHCCWAWRLYWWGWPSHKWTDDLPLRLDRGHINTFTSLRTQNPDLKDCFDPVSSECDPSMLKKQANTRLLTQIVKAPLWAESHLPLQVVRLLCPWLQDSEAIADTRLRHCQLVLT